MQWPPSPGPGWNDMKPNGFVAAASITSHTSMSMRSQSCASSLTSAMLTERKMFSSSFVSSAASAVETSCTLASADARGGLDRPQVGLALPRQRRRHGDDDRIALGDRAEVGRRGDQTVVDELLQRLGGNVGDVALAAVDRVDHGGHHVDEHDLLAGFGEGLRVWHP